jgi:hypothetical protein
MFGHEDIVTISNFKAGVRVWRKKPNWDQDFHNSFYGKLERSRANGLTSIWWNRIVDDLWNWRAIRPSPKDEICRRGLLYLPELQSEYTKLKNLAREQEPNLETSRWDDLEGLFGVAAEIKITMPFSPVFASKLCHFIFPAAYPVVDRQVVGISGSYANYWDYCQAQWVNCQVKDDLIGMLRREIGPYVFGNFPWSNKIVELCMIGKNEISGGLSQ